jgi:outer membrane protein OmpA-like peptidoglycan-associated protein
MLYLQTLPALAAGAVVVYSTLGLYPGIGRGSAEELRRLSQGTALVFLVGTPFLVRLVSVARAHNVTSIAEDTVFLVEGRLVRSAMVLHGMTSVGIGRWFDLSLDIPLHLMQSGDSIQGFREQPLAADVTTLGDIRIIPRFRLFTTRDDADDNGVAIALIADVSAPTGDPEAYAGDDGFRANPKVAFDAYFGSGHSFAMNVGYRIRPQAGFGTLTIDDAVTLATGMNVHVAGPFSLSGEIFGSIGTAGADGAEEIPFEATVAARILSRYFTFQAGGGTGITGGVGAPDWRLVSSLGLRTEPNPDRDADGLLNRADSCPRGAEDFDGFQDEDGCPDVDNDNDGFIDSSDQCPMEAGVLETMGCPANAALPGDADGDGFVDLQDACPIDAEDVDGVEDTDGCPENDRDADGIDDREDYCPDQPGTLALRGCPTDVQDYTLVVTFELDGNELDPADRQQLDRLVTNFATYPSGSRLVVEGHTDNQGNDAHNNALSQRRAETVRDYLVAAGVPSSAITLEFYGATRPLAPNTSRENRAENRRAEVRVDIP